MKRRLFEKLKILFAIVFSLILTKTITNHSLVRSRIKTFIDSFSHQKQIPTPTINILETQTISPVVFSKKSPSPSPTSYLPSPLLFLTPSLISLPTEILPLPTIIIPSPTETPSLPTSPQNFSCPSFSDEKYDITSVLVKNQTPISSRRDLTLPPLIPISTTLSLIYGQIVDPDPKAPQFSTVFSPKRIARFLAAYKAEGEIRGPQSTDVEILEIETTPGETLRFPQTGYDIGGGNGAMVLNATDGKVTFKVGREDNVVHGYTLYFEDICIDKNLESLYQRLNSEGRNNLPAIKIGQVFGFAKTNRIKIGLRDTGTFLDLRLVDKATGESLWK
mgnify:CR=1 FL=1